MGFKGYVVSDSGAVEFSPSNICGNRLQRRVRQSIMAGLNVRTTFDPPEVYVKPLRELVKEGSVPCPCWMTASATCCREMWEGVCLTRLIVR